MGHAVLLVGSEGVSKLLPAAQQNLRQLPVIVLDYPNETCPVEPTVQFTTAIYGVHECGTAYRMDEIPIPLRKVIDSKLPSDHWVLREIMKHCGELN